MHCAGRSLASNSHMTYLKYYVNVFGSSLPYTRSGGLQLQEVAFQESMTSR
jgi:hypothetical protein